MTAAVCWCRSGRPAKGAGRRVAQPKAGGRGASNPSVRGRGHGQRANSGPLPAPDLRVTFDNMVRGYASSCEADATVVKLHALFLGLR